MVLFLIILYLIFTTVFDFLHCSNVFSWKQSTTTQPQSCCCKVRRQKLSTKCFPPHYLSFLRTLQVTFMIFDITKPTYPCRPLELHKDAHLNLQNTFRKQILGEFKMSGNLICERWVCMTHCCFGAWLDARCTE